MYDKFLFCILFAPLKTSHLQMMKQTSDGVMKIAYRQGRPIQDTIASITIMNLCLIEAF